MKIEELIRQLARLPNDAEVGISAADSPTYHIELEDLGEAPGGRHSILIKKRR